MDISLVLFGGSSRLHLFLVGARGAGLCVPGRGAHHELPVREGLRDTSVESTQ